MLYLAHLPPISVLSSLIPSYNPPPIFLTSPFISLVPWEPLSWVPIPYYHCHTYFPISVVTLGYTLTPVELGTTYERQHAAFVFLGLGWLIHYTVFYFCPFICRFHFSYSWINNISLYICSTFSLSIHQLKGHLGSLCFLAIITRGALIIYQKFCLSNLMNYDFLKCSLTILWISLVSVVMFTCSFVILFIWVIYFG